MTKQEIENARQILISNYTTVTEDDIKQDYKGLNYLPWAKAWRLLLEKDPDADYDVLENENGFIFEQFGTLMVKTQITAFGKTRKMWYSIMDNKHNAVKIENLNSNLLNNAIMRCLTKNIAMFGIGLGLYEGEDIPKDSENSSEITKQNKKNKTNPKETLKELCNKIVLANSENKPKIMAILTKYEPNKGLISKMKVEEAKKAIKEIEDLKLI